MIVFIALIAWKSLHNLELEIGLCFQNIPAIVLNYFF